MDSQEGRVTEAGLDTKERTRTKELWSRRVWAQGISALDALEGLAGLVIFWTLSGK